MALTLIDGIVHNVKEHTVVVKVAEGRSGLVITVLLSVMITGQIAGDGRSDWLKGVQLMAVYVIIGLAFFFAPETIPR